MATMYLPDHSCAGTIVFATEDGNAVTVTFEERGERGAVLLETLAAAMRAQGAGIEVDLASMARIRPELN